MDDTILRNVSLTQSRGEAELTMSKYKLSNVGMLLGVISWDVRGYLSEIQRKNCGVSSSTDAWIGHGPWEYLRIVSQAQAERYE